MTREYVLDPKEAERTRKSALIAKRRELRQGAQKEELDAFLIQLRRREHHCTILMHMMQSFTYPNRWLSEPYQQALVHWIDIRTLFRYYEKGHQTRGEFVRSVRRLHRKIKACYKEAGERLASWTVEDQLP